MKFKLTPIKADASPRKFYRIESNKKSKIILNVTKDKYKNLTSYLAINRFLRKKKILAPKLFNFNYNKGVMIIEDFGNLTLHKELLKRKNKLLIYQKIVDLLLKIQKIKTSKKIKSIKNKNHIIRNYSKKILLNESNLFFDWYLPLFISKKRARIIKKKSNKILLKLYNRLSSSNYCFVHRDYHTQNLMKVGKKIGVIDSQDALIGHPAYDLVSLIDDVRIKTSTKLKNNIYDYYIKKRNFFLIIDDKKFFEDFTILSVQRSLKIIGIFSRLFLRDKKKRYLKLIPYTWRLLDQRMNYKIFNELKKIINSNVSKSMKKKVISE